MTGCHAPASPLGQTVVADVRTPTRVMALAGPPNAGKSTLFNLLTGLNQHVGNWPGKTVERREGRLTYRGETWRVVDLPGTYSLTANSEEERIARTYILQERPDVVVVVASAASLEYGLSLLAEVLLLGCPTILALNMMDVAVQHGIQVEPHVLEAALGIPVVPMVAARNEGVEALLETAQRVVVGDILLRPNLPDVGEGHRAVWEAVRATLPPVLTQVYPADWLATKLLEGDAELLEWVERQAPEAWARLRPLLLAHEDAFLDVVSARYAWVERMLRAAVVRPRANVVTLTDRLDRIATHPLWGLVLFLLVSGLMYVLVYSLALPMADMLENWVVGRFGEIVAQWLAFAPAWLRSLLVDGVLGGVGTVFSFLPILAVFFTAMAFLEDVGYLARAAYVMDRFMRWMGLHGRSFLPLFLGFGCNVPAVMGTRIIESRRGRLLTILLAPLVPCSARMAVVTFLAPAFFGSWSAGVVWGLVALNLMVLMFLGWLINRLVYRGERAVFIMEMPLYHLPNLRIIGITVWNHLKAYVQKAGTVILAVSVVVWALAYFPHGNTETSWLAWLGRHLAGLGRGLGWEDWRLMTALLTSFVAKENTIATLGVLYGMSEAGTGLAMRVARTLSPAAALSFLVVQMLFIPCAATVATIRKEVNGRWALLSVVLLLVVSFGMGWLVYRITLLWMG